MRKKIYKFLKIKVSVIIVVLVFFFIALQTPWLKRVIANRLVSRLSEMTQSEVKIKSYEAFIPLNFDFYELTFSQNHEVWLTLDRLSLNRTLIRFFFWKNRAIDVSLIHPMLIKKPILTKNPSPHFVWPEFPFQKLSIRLNSYQIEINPALTTKTLPKFNAFNNVHVRRGGELIDLRSYLNSPELPGVELLLDIEGNQKKNLVSLQLSAKDLDQKVTEYFLQKKVPEFDGNISLSGDPEAILSFFNFQKESHGSFRGEIKGRFLPSDEDSDFFAQLLNEENLKVSSQFEYEKERGLSFHNLKIKGSELIFNGEGRVNPDSQFVETTLKGSLERLKVLSFFTGESIEGTVDLDAKLSGPFEHPKVEADFSSPKLETEYVLGEKLNGFISIQKTDQVFQGDLYFSGDLNKVSSSLKTEFAFSNFKDLSLEHFNLLYGENSIGASRFKMLSSGTIFQGNLEFKFQDMSTLSPFFKHALHGNAMGNLILDIDLAPGAQKQKIDLTFEGDHFAVTQLELNQYFFHGEGKLKGLDLTNFEGNLFFKNQSMSWKHYKFQETQLALNPKNQSSPYRLETTGDLTISSSGQISKLDDDWTLVIRILQGHAYKQSYSLSRSLGLSWSDRELSFSPLDLKIGPGHLYVNLDSKEKILQAQTEKFPVETLSIFIPKFDLKGYVDLNGSFTNLSSEMSGKLSGSVYQFSIEDYHNMSPFKGVFDLKLDQEHLIGKASFYERKKDRGTLDFKIPFGVHFYPFKLDLNTEEDAFIDLRYKGMVNPFIQAILPQNHLLEGKTEISFQLKGALSHPHMRGFATLNHGYYENLFLGLVLKNITSKLEAKGEKIELSHFDSNDDLEGQIKASGEVSLNFDNKMPFHINVDLESGKVIQFDFLDATFTGGLSLKGNLDQAELKGDLDVSQANVTIPNYFGSNLPKLPVTYIYPRERKCPKPDSNMTPFIPINFDLHLDVADKVTLKGRGLDTVWGGKLDIQGDDKRPQFEGKLKNKEGTFVFAGKVLTLEEGLIKFDGDLLKKTYINLIARTQIHNAKILAYLQGPILGPKLSFRSDPPHSQTEIVSLILFNEPVKKLKAFQAVSLTHSLSTLGGTYLGPDIIDKVRRGIGVDQLTFGSSIQKGGDYTTIQVGKYITRNVLITLNRPLSTGTSPFVITAHVKGGIELQTYFDENELSKIRIQWKLSY